MSDSDTKGVWTRYGILPLRLLVGLGFLAHGMAKWNRGPAAFAKLLHVVGVPFPLFSAWMVTGLEIFGGLLLIIGLYAAVAGIPLAISMVTAMATVHWRYGFSSVNTIGLTPSGPLFGPPGYEINLLYIAALLVIILSGPGLFSVDGWIARRKIPTFRSMPDTKQS